MAGKAWRLAFAGAPTFAATILTRLIDSPHHVALVYTQPDRRAGRGRALAPSAVRKVAEHADIEVRTPTRLAHEAEKLREFDCLVVAAYGRLLPQAILCAPKYNCLNVHASLLPRWRGAAPVERAIMAGDKETGVSIMRIDAGLDTGPVYRRETLALTAETTGATATAALAELGAKALLDTLDELPECQAVPQDDRFASYAPKLSVRESLIDWRESAAVVDRRVRALSGRMAAYTTLEGDARMRILEALPIAGDEPTTPGTLRRVADRWQVACGEGALLLATVQLNRGRGTPQPIANVVNGYPRLLFDGARLGV